MIEATPNKSMSRGAKTPINKTLKQDTKVNTLYHLLTLFVCWFRWTKGKAD